MKKRDDIEISEIAVLIFFIILIIFATVVIWNCKVQSVNELLPLHIRILLTVIFAIILTFLIIGLIATIKYGCLGDEYEQRTDN